MNNEELKYLSKEATRHLMNGYIKCLSDYYRSSVNIPYGLCFFIDNNYPALSTHFKECIYKYFYGKYNVMNSDDVFNLSNDICAEVLLDHPHHPYLGRPFNKEPRIKFLESIISDLKNGTNIVTP